MTECFSITLPHQNSLPILTSLFKLYKIQLGKMYMKLFGMTCSAKKCKAATDLKFLSWIGANFFIVCRWGVNLTTNHSTKLCWYVSAAWGFSFNKVVILSANTHYFICKLVLLQICCICHILAFRTNLQDGKLQHANCIQHTIVGVFATFYYYVL